MTPALSWWGMICLFHMEAMMDDAELERLFLELNDKANKALSTCEGIAIAQIAQNTAFYRLNRAR